MGRDAEFRIAAKPEFVERVKRLSRAMAFASMSEYCRMAIMKQVRRDEREMEEGKRERGRDG